MEPDRTELIAKTIFRIEDCFACKYVSKNTISDEMVINFHLTHGLEKVTLKFCLFNKSSNICGFDVVARINEQNKGEIVHTLQWSDFDPDEGDEDLVLSKIQAKIFSFVENWIDSKDLIKLMAWVKSTGYNSTLLKKIKEITEKVL